MCFNCGDWVGYCDRDECSHFEGGPYNRFEKFYIGSRYCRHKIAEYGHEIATAADAYPDGED